MEPEVQLDSGRSTPGTMTVFVPKGSISFINVLNTSKRINGGSDELGSKLEALSAGKQLH